MLDHLRQRVIEALTPVQAASLATCGPAGLRARFFPCEALGLRLYLLVPGTSDHLFNLEQQEMAVVSTPEWQVQGAGHILPLAAAPPELALPQKAEAPGCVLVEIQPTRLQINCPNTWGFRETIDVDE